MTGSRSHWRRGLAVAWTVAVFAMLWAPPPPTPRVEIPHFDKYVHFSLFAIFGALWRWAGLPWRRVLLLAVPIAIATELGQGLVPWPRTPDVLDVVADLAGVGLALGAMLRNGRDSNPR
ncbi:MAG: VanZ family protein [Nannocystaceae bacterium]|nr:VanZ family protein [Nannocystaceae bacterium]